MSLNLYDILQRVLNEAVGSNSVRDAITQHRYVQITYSDEHDSAPGKRLIQPYAYGMSTSNNELLRAFQVSGDSLRGKPAWKTFRLDRITSWKPRRQTFSSPPPMQGYNAPDYNSEGDETMANVILQASFGSKDDTLSNERQKTKSIVDAPKISVKNSSGPIPVHQQWKKNVYTSQPNSEKYATIARNIDNTENDFDRFNDDIWAAAEAERKQQDMAKEKSVKLPKQNQQGPVDTNVTDKKDIDKNGK